MAPHRTVSRQEWIIARQALLAREKELTRFRDELSRLRRELPWVKIDKPYVFEGETGRVGLADLFDGRSQLIVQHFMFGPGWAEGCVGCSFGADHVDGARQHLENHDVSFAAISRATYPEIAAYKKRMGWGFNWVSAHDGDFNYDFNVSFRPQDIVDGKVLYNYAPSKFESEEMPGMSAFFRNDAGEIFHTYSTYGRGDEMTVTTYMYLDIAPLGRNETGPHFNLLDWVRRHDQYDKAAKSGDCCHGEKAG